MEQRKAVQSCKFRYLGSISISFLTSGRIILGLKMKPPKKFLNELVSDTKDHTIKVYAKEKLRVRTPPGKAKHQSILFVDDKGNEMWGKLFGTNVDALKTIIEAGGHYEISNILARDVNPHFNTKDKQELFLNEKTDVVHIVGESTSMGAPRLHRIADVPLTPHPDQRFDIIALVLHIGPPKVITTRRGTQSTVSELYVVDDSTQGPTLVSIWNDLAHIMYEALANVVNNNVIISLCALRVARYQGAFSFSTTLSTDFHVAPTRDAVSVLSKWCAVSENLINQYWTDARKPRIPVVPTETITIGQVLSMKGQDIQPGQLARIFAVLCDLSDSDVKVLLGCDHCNATCVASIHKAITCKACKKESTAEVKLYFPFKAKDDTATIELTGYTKNVQKLFDIQADELYSMSVEDRHVFVEAAKERLTTNPSVFTIYPSPSLLVDHNVVKWMLKDVIKD